VPFFDRRTANVLLTILVFAAVCAAIYSARHILLIFVLAIFFAYLINPVVKFLQRHSMLFRNLRGPAVVEVYVGFVILMALLGYKLAPGLGRNAAKLLDEVPSVMDGLSTGNIATELKDKYGWSDAQESRFRAFLVRHREDIQGLTAIVDRYLSNAAQIAGGLFLVPVLAIFFLRDGDYIANIFIQLFFPANRRMQVRAVANELHLMLTEYIRAQVLLCCLSFLFYSGATLLLRFPHPIALGFLGGLLEFIPGIGWITTAAVIAGVGVVNHLHWIWMVALLAAWRMIQDYYAAPRIMRSHLKIHQLAAIFAVLVGAEIGGIVGIYLAIPLTASIRLIWRACAEQQGGQSYVAISNASPEAPACLAETATI
jgi:predicted PurR-regulated permease PerM